MLFLCFWTRGIRWLHFKISIPDISFIFSQVLTVELILGENIATKVNVCLSRILTQLHVVQLGVGRWWFFLFSTEDIGTSYF